MRGLCTVLILCVALLDPVLCANCGAGQFGCRTGNKCIDKSQYCNFVNDCSDGSDEADCPTTCDFSNGECGWYEGSPDNAFNWLRGRAVDTTLIPNLAPRYDHTEKNDQGYYAYINISGSLTYPYPAAEYYSPVFSSAAAGCKVSLWYYQDGRIPLSLELYFVTNTTESKIFTMYGKVGDQWNNLIVGIGRQVESWQIRFNKLGYASYNGATAIDDIQFLDCSPPRPQSSCNSDQFRCEDRGSCIDKNMVCNFDDDCGDGYDERPEECDSYTMCNFENATCGWTQPTDTDHFDWNRAKGEQWPRNTGPRHDHTFRNSSGYYMYMRSSYSGYGRKGQLISPIYQRTTSGTCKLRVFHYMYGQHVGRLSIYARIYNNSNQGQTLLWEHHAQKGLYWDRADVSFRIDTDFQIVIEAMHGDSFYGNIAIDDISLTPDCKLSTQAVLPEAPPTTPSPVRPSPTPHPACTSSEYFCQLERRCIPGKFVCNFINDCDGGDDELNCAKPFCNFEYGDCGWRGINSLPRRRRRDDLPPFIWDKQQGKTKRLTEYRPAVDHTTNSGEGYYVFADNSPGEGRDTTDIISPVIGETGPNCHLAFWFHMTQSNTGTLEVLIKSGNETNTRFSMTSTAMNEWQRGIVYLGTGQGYQVIFRAIRGSSYRGDECLDDITFMDCAIPVLTGNPCTSTEFRCSNQYCIDNSKLCNFVDDCMDMSDEQHCDTLAGRCNFEIDMCGWTNEKGDNFDWTFSSGGTRKKGTGPITDHTSRSEQGGYMIMLAHYYQSPNLRTRLASPTIRGTSTNCRFRMWYHMLGRHIGSLYVYLRTSYLDNTNGMELVKNITGNQGDYWASLEYVVDNKGKDFRIILEGRIGTGSQGDIAIDDVTFTAGCILGGHVPGEEDEPEAPDSLPACLNDPLRYQCDSGNECFDPWQRCNFNNDCQDNSDENGCGNSCDFESGQCGWQNTIGNNVKWTWTQGPSWSARTGPNVDHTTGTINGYFMLLKTDTFTYHTEYKAHLMSLAYQETSKDCELVFWYYMFGYTVDSLAVHLKYETGQSERLWVKNGNLGESWRNATISIGKRDRFWIIFEGTRGTGRYGDIAIDDIQFNNCGEVAGARACDTSTEFECRDDKRCLSLDAVCDHRNDCGDASDEQNCTHRFPDCHFDHKDIESCQWKQLDDDNFNWSVDKTTPSTGTGPAFDHTTGSDRNSYFAYVDSSEQSNGNIARISTSDDSPFPATIGVCSLRFWYHMYSSQVVGMGTLRVYTESNLSNKQRLLMWQMHGNQGNGWKYARIVISNPHKYKVVFEAIVGNPGLSDIAIDDVTFTSSCLHPLDNQTSPCLHGEIKCPNDDLCIPYEWLNDGKVDCRSDCYDEDNLVHCEGSRTLRSESTGMIAGGVIGGLIAFGIVLVIVVLAIRYHRKTGGFTFSFNVFGFKDDDKVRMSEIDEEPHEVETKAPKSMDNPVYEQNNSNISTA